MNPFQRKPPPGYVALSRAPAASSSVVTPPPVQTDGARGGLEAAQRTVPLPAGGVAPIYATVERWRALDVYADLSAATLNAVSSFIEVAIFAVARGRRTLVATGRSRARTDGLFRIASVRLPIAEHFEVELGYGDLPATTAEGVGFSILASNDAMPASAEDVDGIITLSGVNARLLAVATAAPAPQFPFEVVALNAVSAVAGLFLHVHDVGSVVPATLNNRAPILAFGPVGVSGVYVEPRMGRKRNSGLAFCLSTTANVTTLAAAGDWGLQAWLR